MSLELKTQSLSDPNRCCFCTGEILPEDLHIDPVDNTSRHLACERERNGVNELVEGRIKIKSLIEDSRKFREDQIGARAQEAKDKIKNLARECLEYYLVLSSGLKKVPTNSFNFVLDENNSENFAMYSSEHLKKLARRQYRFSVYHLGSIIQTKSVEGMVEEEVEAAIKKKLSSQENISFFKRLYEVFLDVFGLQKEEVEHETKIIQKKETKTENYVVGQNCSIGSINVTGRGELGIDQRCREQFIYTQEKNLIGYLARGNNYYANKNLNDFEKAGTLDEFVQQFRDERDHLKELVELIDLIYEFEDPKEQLEELQALFGKEEFQ